ncbi:flagellar filament capping protein FliD [Paenibacillus sp. LHD-117]|uniref:flagellar filament capping protein FliD n=1 Tax=Paenibacillus sp. LHD-117 TaxID=3071412 RepID=UPI0027DFA47A|nr:flagellar filament capping protein FliD [Paenibacillus sp. LHD-117]MDQ6422499.1 flagellar filament capping protein FliD [Paenibacillus sp. LHD-117]
MRIGGLASGMDTDTIIKQLMTAQRAPLDKLSQKKQLVEWKRDDYRALNNKILEFRNVAFDMKLQSGYLTKKVSSSQESIVSVSASPLANEGQYSMKIEQLAKSATLNSGDLAGAASSTKTLGSLSLSSDTQLIITGEKGSKTINIKMGDSIDQLVTAINNESASTGVKASYDANMDRLFFTSAKTGASSQINLELANGDNISNIFGFTSSSEVTEGTVSFATSSSLVDGGIVGTKALTVNYDGQDYNFDITATTTIGSLVDKINGQMNKVGISVRLNSNGEMSFHNSDKSKPISVSDNDGNNIVNKLGIDESTMNVNSSAISMLGTNAKVLFNGIEAEYDSNTFTIAGMTFTAKQTSNTVVDIGVSQDVDAVVDRIKSFVEKYNTLLDEVNKELLEKKQRSFQPLTDEQRKEMDEDEIKRWEERARSGMLSNDTLITSGLNGMRLSLSDSVSGIPTGQIKSLTEIGISNTNINGTSISGTYADRGKLYIDEDKLKKALIENPDEVMALFTNDGATGSSDGIATRLYDRASTLFKEITDKAGATTSNENSYSMGKENIELKAQMDRLTLRLMDIEDRYYKQFTAMEKYINQMNSQSAWLTQQFSQ